MTRRAAAHAGRGEPPAGPAALAGRQARDRVGGHLAALAGHLAAARTATEEILGIAEATGSRRVGEVAIALDGAEVPWRLRALAELTDTLARELELPGGAPAQRAGGRRPQRVPRGPDGAGAGRAVDEARALSWEEKVLALAELIPPVAASNYVPDWPEDEQRLYREGDFASFTERNAALDLYRRTKAAHRVLAQMEAWDG